MFPRQLFRFFVESFLLIGFVLSFWLTYPLLFPRSPLAMIHFSLRLASLLAITAQIFFALVFYGTSFEVTPLKLAAATFYPFVRLLAHRLKRQGQSKGDDGKVEIADFTPPHTEEIKVSQQFSAESILQDAAYSASEIATRMERRMNVYLILGVLVGLVGLAVWYFSFLKVTMISGWDLVREALPRITILVFIELLAGFFLRQYRIGVEDFKYFLPLKRQADASRVSYFILTELQDKEGLRAFANSISQAAPDFKLRSGESTTALEAMKAEENVSLAALKLIGENLRAVAKWVQTKG